ncbi:MAG: efflux RND transporter permease subunit [Ekhidna sp.]
MNPEDKGNAFVISFSSGQNDPPLVTEQSITSILEGVLSTIGEVKEVNSVSRYGGGYITLVFEDGEDFQQKYLEILTAIRQVRNKLPENVPFPVISRGKREDAQDPLLIYTLTSSLPHNVIVELANEQLLSRIGKNPGISRIVLSNDSRQYLKISFRMEKLLSLGLSIQDIQQALRSGNVSEQIGSITSDGYSKSVMMKTTAEDITDLLRIPIRKNLLLQDLVSVEIEDQRPTFISRYNGENAISLSIFIHDHLNKLQLAKEIKSETGQLTSSLPNGLSLMLSYDDTDFVSKELFKISKRATLSVLVLSLLVLLVYRRLKQLMVLISSVFVSVGISALIMYLLRIPVHLYTIAGITISFGLIIDNSIMVIDHLRRNRDLKVINALLAATLTTIAALLVIFVLPQEERIGMGDFAVAISIALCSSIAVSLLFTPAFAKMMASKKERNSISINKKRILVKIQKAYFDTLRFASNYKTFLVVTMIILFGLPVYLVPKKIEGVDIYNRTIGSEVYQEEVRPYTDKFFGGMLRAFYLNVFESSGYRTPEKTRLYVTASLDEGHTIEQLNSIVQKVEEYLSQVRGLSDYKSSIYSGKYAQVVIEFDDEQENGSLPFTLKNRLIQRSLDWGGVDWNVYGVGRGFSNARGESMPSFRVKLTGYNYDELEGLANDLAEKLLVHPRIKDVNTNDRVSWRDENTEQFFLKPIGATNADSYLTSVRYVKSLAPSYTADDYITLNNTRLPVRFEDEEKDKFGIYRLQNESVQLPLNRNSELVRDLKTNALYRENRSYVRVLSFDYFGSYRFGNEYLEEVLNASFFPPGYSFEKIQFSFDAGKTKRQYGLISLILLLVFVICAVTFESWKLPFLVIMVIPFSFIGLFMIFTWGGFYFDQGGYAAFILLAGIVVNASIFIVAEAMNYTSNNWSRNIIKACSRKFTAIMLTIVSTCLGLVPFLLEGQQEVFWFSFSVGVIGGLIFSVLLVFGVLPVMLMKKTL